MPEEPLPPQSLHAEKAVLGCMLHDNRTIDDVVRFVGESDFYSFLHQRLFRGILELRRRQVTVDLVSIWQWVCDNKLREELGDDSYLAGLWNDTPVGSAEYFARVVRDKAIKRMLAIEGKYIAAEANDPSQSAEELLAEAQTRILAIGQEHAGCEVYMPAELVGTLAKRLDDRFTGREQPGLPTGLRDLDDILGGIRPSDLVVVGARTSIGKTSFAMTVALNVAAGKQAALPALVVSLEQGRQELMERLLCMVAKVDSHRVRQASVSEEEQRQLANALDEVGRLLIPICDAPGNMTMAKLAAIARREKHKRGIGLVVIDYLQLIEPENRKLARHEQMTAISRATKALARELAVPVLALAQLQPGLGKPC